MEYPNIASAICPVLNGDDLSLSQPPKEYQTLADKGGSSVEVDTYETSISHDADFLP